MLKKLKEIEYVEEWNDQVVSQISVVSQLWDKENKSAKLADQRQLQGGLGPEGVQHPGVPTLPHHQGQRAHRGLQKTNRLKTKTANKNPNCQEKMGTPAGEFNLLSRGKRLELYHTLDNFAVKNGDTLFMVQAQQFTKGRKGSWWGCFAKHLFKLD
jgi:hypothetical protein